MIDADFMVKTTSDDAISFEKVKEANRIFNESLMFNPLNELVTYPYPRAPKPQPKPHKVWFNPPYTTVEFSDGTKVTSKATDVEFNKYSGFMACVMKKIYGSTSKCLSMLEDCEHVAEITSPSYKRKRLNSLLKARKWSLQQDEQRRKEALIQSKMEEIQATKEAERRLKKEEENQ